jgi:hypothetical protein
MQRTAMALFLLAGVVISLGLVLTACTASNAAPAQPYTNAELGLRYVPPDGFRDLTAAVKQSEEAHPRDGKPQFELLLRMMSSPDDKAPDWATLGITTYPRGRDKDKGDDVTAGYFTNFAFASGNTVKREVTRFGGRDFSTTHFEKIEPPLTKYGVVYTTVYKEKFVTFFFSGNDRERILKLTQSMSSVSFKP